MKKIFNNGYVRLVDTMGSDLSVVNSARVSFNRATETLRPEDEKLIAYLAKNDHTSPFRHATLQFEVYAPLMVARQWWKYIIGSSHQDPFTAWNESSRRYVTEEIEFYIPKVTDWRSKPENSKQGSGPNLDEKIGGEALDRLLDQIKSGMENYNWAIDSGIATEQARLFIPSAYGLMVRWYWTVSLQGVAHFLQQRTDDHAQFEIREYAQAVKELAKEKFPVSLDALLNHL
ncbi:MAG: thymidylate synthase, flavin-dependent [Clostridiales bacterium 38-18]|nr:MAG: thymidylate synthase, flavin-dependent [Clostridiales bacterium 38-18]